MADIFILDRNRSTLKTIFSKHCVGDALSFTEMLKFATAVRIYPVRTIQDLLSSLELKRLFLKAADKGNREDGKVELAYFQFEKMLKLVATHCFSQELQPAEKLQMLFAHVQHLCEVHYKANLVTHKDVPTPRFESLNSSGTSRPVLRKQSSMSQITTRKPASKGNSSVSRLTSGLDSATTERPSKAQALKQRVQKLYRMLSPKQGTMRKKPNVQRRIHTDVDSPSDSTARFSSVPESTRLLTDGHYFTFDRRESEKMISLLPSYNTSQTRDRPAAVLYQVKRAVANLEMNTNLVLKRSKLQSRRRLAAVGLTRIYCDSEVKVVNMQRAKLKVGFLRWKLAVSAGSDN